MEQQEKDRSGERASFGPSPAAPRFYQQESEKLAEQRRAREEQSATARLLTPKNATGRRGVLPAAPRDPLRLAQSIVAATRQFAALPPPVGERRSIVRWVATHRDIVEAVAGSIERGAASFDGSSRPKTDEVALVRVFEWLFVDEGPHACLAFLDDKKPGCGGEAAIDDGGVSDADKREAFARLNQAVASVAVKRLRECRLAIPELLARMWTRVWQAAAAASGGDDGAELAAVGLLSAIARVYERLAEHRYRDFFSRRLEPIDDEPFIRFVADNKSVAIVAAGLELIRGAMYYRFGQIFGQRTWTHLLVNTVIHPDHYIRRWAHSSLDFRYCHDDLRVEICQLRMSRLRQEEDPTVKARLLKSLTRQSGSDMRALLEPPFTEMQNSNGKVARAATALLSWMVFAGGVSLDQEQVARAIEIVHPGLLPQVRREGSLTAQLLCFLANNRPGFSTSADAAHLPQDLRERVAATTAGFAKYRERALGLVSQMCVLERNATKLLVAIHDWLQADGTDKWHRASGLVALSAVVRSRHKGRPDGQQPPVDPLTDDEEEEQGDNLHDHRNDDGEDDDDDNGERRHDVAPPHDDAGEEGDDDDDDDDMEHQAEHIKQALAYTPYVIACLQDPEPVVRYGACEAMRWMWKWSSPGQRLTASNLLVDLAAAGTDQGAPFVQRKAFATLQGLLDDAPYDGEEDIIFASCVARLQRHDGPDHSPLHLVMQLARAGGLRDPKERTMELAELMMPVLVAKMRHVQGVELVSCMLAAIEYVLPLGPRCPLAREVSLLVGQRWAEVFPRAKHFRLSKPAKNFERRHALLADLYDALEPQP